MKPELYELPADHPATRGLPPGRTFCCAECWTRVREGQPHIALLPRPHATLAALIHVERLPEPDGTLIMEAL